MRNRSQRDKPRGEIRALTGLRGVAAAYVVLYHMLQDVPDQGPLPTMIRHGYIAVDLFFVLSGFVMAMVHGADRFDRTGYASFLRKRLGRIYPLYAAVTLAALVVDGLAHVPISPGRLAVNAVLLQGWGLGTAIVAPSWSLSAEFGAYLLFPWLALLMLDGARSRAVLGVAAAMTLLGVVSLSAEPRSGPLDLYQTGTVAPLLRCLGGFVLGLAAYRICCGGVLASYRGSPWLGLGLGIALVGLLAWRNTDLLLVALMVPFVVALSSQDGGYVGRLLSSAPVHRLGVLSFSIYLVHFPIREWLRPPVSGWLNAQGLPHPAALATLMACATALVVANLTYHLIERPARSMVRTRFELAPHAP